MKGNFTMKYNLHVCKALEKRITRNCDTLLVAKKNLLLFAFVNGYAKFLKKQDSTSYFNELINKYRKKYKALPSKTISIKVSDYIDRQIKDLRILINASQQDIFLAIAINEFTIIEEKLERYSISEEEFGYQSECRTLLKCLGSEQKDFQRIAEAFVLHDLLFEIYSDITYSPEYLALKSEDL